MWDRPSPKGTAPGQGALSKPHLVVALGGTVEAADAMLLLWRAVPLSAFRRRINQAQLREKARL